MTDASNHGFGGVLFKEEGDSWRPIGFVSRKLKGAEFRYTLNETECLAVVFALREFVELDRLY